MTAPTWRLLLPADWWRVPLEDPERRTASVAALVEQQFRGVDDQPVLRRSLLEELQGMAEAAAAENGRLLAIATGLAAGVPMTSVLTVGVSHSGAARAIDVRRLARDLRQSTHGEVEVVDLPAGNAVRRAYQQRPRMDTGDAEVVSTVVDFHVPIPGRDGSVLRLTFSSPLPSPVVEAAMDLWDAIATTLTWDDGAAGAAPGEEGDVQQEA